MANVPPGNGCDFWPEGVFGIDWTKCCDAHDYAYGQGGDLLKKLAADDALRVCVDHLLPGMGGVMFLGVVVFGGLFWSWKRRKR